MTQAAAAIFQIPTVPPQPSRAKSSRAVAAKPRAASLNVIPITGVSTRAATRGDGEVIELDYGITVYPPREAGDRWRAVWHENGKRKQCGRSRKRRSPGSWKRVRRRLAAGASNATRPGADLIAWYRNPDRLPVAKRWSRRHADNQRRPGRFQPA
jgi:hypothetical protein